jgi:uncharacterized protein YbjQ (UPF0145 family)
MARTTGFSGNEIFCMGLKGFAAGEVVIGNSVNSMGFLGGVTAAGRGLLGGEVDEVTAAIHSGRAAALDRMTREASDHGACGVAGVTSELRSFSGYTEFMFVGSCLHSDQKGFFSSAGNAQELYCHMDAGYEPLRHVFGNVAYSMGVGGKIMGSLRTLARGEVGEYSDVFNRTRHLALERVAAEAARNGANAVVGIRTTIRPWKGIREMLMSGTAARHRSLPTGHVATSDLTGEELWAMSRLGYAPISLLMSTSIYSVGIVGGIAAAFKSFVKGEVSGLTTLVHDAREVAFDRLRREADEIGAEEVVGVKTFITELGSGLVEFMAIGTAVRHTPGVEVLTKDLPAQAIIHDKDTWVGGDFGVSLDRSSRTDN